MDSQIAGAWIAAITALVVAIMSILFTGRTRQSIARVEETAKQWEQVRVEATQAGQKILAASARLIIAAEGYKFAIERLPPGQSVDLAKLTLPMASPLNEMATLVYSTEIYTTEDIRNRADDLIGRAQFPEPETIGELVDELKRLHTDIADLFRVTYLPAALRGSTEHPG